MDQPRAVGGGGGITERARETNRKSKRDIQKEGEKDRQERETENI